MRRLMIATLLLLSSPLYAQQGTGTLAPATTAVSPSLYAINSAALASAMTFCITRHGELTVGSAGEACFQKARRILAGSGLKQRADEVDRQCRANANFNTCLTPEIGKLVFELNAEFAKQKL